MLKYVDTVVTFSEIPDEVALCISISGCPIHCPDCHSKYLWDDIGEELDIKALMDIIDRNKGVTCICFMGGDQDIDELKNLAISCRIRSDYPYRVAWYSGREKMPENGIMDYLDYIKLGPYKEEFGPINKTTTNQRLYAKGKILNKPDASPNRFYDITDKFWNN